MYSLSSAIIELTLVLLNKTFWFGFPSFRVGSDFDQFENSEKSFWMKLADLKERLGKQSRLFEYTVCFKWKNILVVVLQIILFVLASLVRNSTFFLNENFQILLRNS